MAGGGVVVGGEVSEGTSFGLVGLVFVVGAGVGGVLGGSMVPIGAGVVEELDDDDDAVEEDMMLVVFFG